jgi:phosphoserine phosphatase
MQQVKKTTKIYIIRHGQSFENAILEAKGRIDSSSTFGDLQSPLTDLGKKQAQKVAKKLRNVKFEAIFSSDLIRARETAEIIAKNRDIILKTENSIRERKYGKQFHQLTKEQRKKLRDALVSLNEEEKFTHRYFPDGESAKEAVDRFRAFLNKVIPLYAGKIICVVNHGAVMRMFLVSIGWAKYTEIPSGSINNTGFYVIDTDGIKFTVKKTVGIKKRVSNDEK